MELKALLHDDDAVSPVIGVILMVAITVILAAVIASFVLGMGDDATNSQPTANFATEFEETEDGYGLLTVEHDGGESVSAGEIYIRGDGFASEGDDSEEIPSDDADLHDPGAWEEGDGDPSGNYASDSQLSSSDRIVVAVESDYEIDVVWESSGGGDSAPLHEDSGPDA